MSIIVFVGASGTGKSTAADALCEQYGAQYVVSYTSRSQRPDEPSNGAMLYDVPRADLEMWQVNGEMEWVDEYAGNLYGTKKKDLEEACKTNELRLMILVPPVLLRLDAVIKQWGGEVTYLFFDPAPDAVLAERMKVRNISPGEYAARMAKVAWYQDESEKTGLPFVHIQNEGTIPELVTNVVAAVTKK